VTVLRRCSLGLASTLAALALAAPVDELRLIREAAEADVP
jgi:hypothetical protein